MRHILSIDGGGIRGVFPASFLATIEDSLETSVVNYFDLIVGTSTGGIIALGLGLGLSAKEILNFYLVEGPGIFGGNRLLRGLRAIGFAKYSRRPLEEALERVFGDCTLGASGKRLVIPSFNLDTGEVHVWKTAHHARFERDYKARAVEVALSTAAAPTYYPVFRSSAGIPLIDGGVWANNPVAVAVVEAIGVLGWRPDELRILSLGCTTSVLNIRWGRVLPLGQAYWARKISDVFITAQSSVALGMVQHLLPDRGNLIRIDPKLPSHFTLDRVSEISSLTGLGDSEARKALASLRPLLFAELAVDDFKPFHS